MVKAERTHLIKESILILLGILSATFGLKGFLLPGGFIDGGVTGISLILTEVTPLPLSLLLVAVNLPFIILAYFNMSRYVALKSVVAIALLAISVHTLSMPVVTSDKLLIAVFGGFFLGMGIGLAIRGGAVIDGTEILAVFINRKTAITIGDIILIFNLIIFSVAAKIFSIEIALYAILTYLAASRTVDFVVAGIEEYVGVTIVSPAYEEIRQGITNNMKRGCTLYAGKGGYAPKGEDLQELNILYTLITRLELARLYTEVDKVDPEAFIVMHAVKDARGGVVKQRGGI